jgi:hypothetical protein
LLFVQFLKRPLIRDSENILRLSVSRFVNHRQDFARRLGAESLAELLRQCPAKTGVSSHLVSATRDFLNRRDDRNSLKIVIELE